MSTAVATLFFCWLFRGSELPPTLTARYSHTHTIFKARCSMAIL